MQHVFIHDGLEPLTWRQAFPSARVLSRHEALAKPWPLAPAMVWCRIAEGEAVSARLAAFRARTTLPLIALFDAPRDEGLLEALSAGASGGCNSHAAPEVLQQVALVVGNGGLWVGPGLLQRLLGGAGRVLGGQPDESWTASLSEREREVARQVAAGGSNKEIAARLAITERTVKAHLGAIFEKLGIRDRLQLSLRVNGNLSR